MDKSNLICDIVKSIGHKEIYDKIRRIVDADFRYSKLAEQSAASHLEVLKLQLAVLTAKINFQEDMYEMEEQLEDARAGLLEFTTNFDTEKPLCQNNLN